MSDPDEAWVLHNPPPDTGETVRDAQGHSLRIPPRAPEVFRIGNCEIAFAPLMTDFPHLLRFLSRTHSTVGGFPEATLDAVDDYLDVGRTVSRLHATDPELHAVLRARMSALHDGLGPDAPINRGAIEDDARRIRAAFDLEFSDRLAAARMRTASRLADDLEALLARYGDCAPQAYALMGGLRHTRAELSGMAAAMRAI